MEVLGEKNKTKHGAALLKEKQHTNVKSLAWKNFERKKARRRARVEGKQKNKNISHEQKHKQKQKKKD